MVSVLQDSNPQPLKHESSPITTRPGLPPYALSIFLFLFSVPAEKSRKIRIIFTKSLATDHRNYSVIFSLHLTGVNIYLFISFFVFILFWPFLTIYFSSSLSPPSSSDWKWLKGCCYCCSSRCFCCWAQAMELFWRRRWRLISALLTNNFVLHEPSLNFEIF